MVAFPCHHITSPEEQAEKWAKSIIKQEACLEPCKTSMIELKIDNRQQFPNKTPPWGFTGLKYPTEKINGIVRQ